MTERNPQWTAETTDVMVDVWYASKDKVNWVVMHDMSGMSVQFRIQELSAVIQALQEAQAFIEEQNVQNP